MPSPTSNNARVTALLPLPSQGTLPVSGPARGSQALSDDLTFQTAELLIIAHDLAVQRDDPPPLALPFRRNERGVECALVAEIERPWRFVNGARFRDDARAAVGWLACDI